MRAVSVFLTLPHKKHVGHGEIALMHHGLYETPP